MKKNVAIIIPQLAGGGAERVASNLSLYLPEEKYNKFVIVYNKGEEDYPYKGKMVNINTKISSNPLTKMKNFFTRIHRLKKIKKEYGIEVSISLLTRTNITNILSRNNDKIIVSVRNYLSKSSKGFYGKVNNFLIKLLYNKADSIVAVSRVIKNDLIENFGIKEQKIDVINNPYDLDKIHTLSLEPIDEVWRDIFKNPTVITVGRLAEQKGQWHLIRVFNEVKRYVPGAKLVIIGQGELETYLKSLVSKLKLERDVFFLGYQTNPFKFVANSTLFAFPSLYEGFPNTLCEAMGSGVPVLASDCKSGPKEILSPSSDLDEEIHNTYYSTYGTLTPVCEGEFLGANASLTPSEITLASGIISILNDDSIQEYYANKSLIRSRDFSYEKIMKKWDEIL
ncbi:glycosyltransferase [Halobacillus litoralis]|uniref:glycosyltransferase n=1 Tax=Halobacillus litoralis TaxID=45668 RepID=UPI00136D0379|nr:glycosyltransferase [Halobacillus litoralis]MYL36418.1 glycosyltransferase [Halobacillus litoralis]